jgi:hypothetical protein
MLDEFREQASTSSLYEEDEETFEEIKPYRPKKRFLGMTAGQRLIIALLLLFAVCILGMLALLVFERISLPFF